MFFYIFCFATRSPSSVGRSPRNFATLSEGSCVWQIRSQNLGASPPKKSWGRKTCNIWVDFGPLQSSIANISGTDRGIKNRKDMWSRAIPPAFGEKSLLNSLTAEILTRPSPKCPQSDVQRRVASRWALPHISSWLWIWSLGKFSVFAPRHNHDAMREGQTFTVCTP